ncbi:MAG: amino acid ABC transporter ATP-binding protein [Elusimicrobia bacterium]|nr:amino acid ABC transporter ATP-binding protein [Elusimicrobiota bacterium]
MITVENLVKSFRHQRVLNGISLEQGKGEVVVLIGPSGCGKTTLLRCINQLETFDSGRVKVGDIAVEACRGHLSKDDRARQLLLRSRVGMVFQSFNLFPHMTAIENIIEAPMTVKEWTQSQAVKRGLDLLAKVGLEEKADFYPAQLSGGQQQRVAIARALAMEPEVMLFDEPTSALDPELKEDVLNVMRRLASEGMTMLVVTHEMAFARDMADRLIFIEAGRIVEQGPADVICRQPKHDRTKEFLKTILPRKSLKGANGKPPHPSQGTFDDVWDGGAPDGEQKDG